MAPIVLLVRVKRYVAGLGRPGAEYWVHDSKRVRGLVRNRMLEIVQEVNLDAAETEPVSDQAGNDRG